MQKMNNKDCVLKTMGQEPKKVKAMPENMAKKGAGGDAGNFTDSQKNEVSAQGTPAGKKGTGGSVNAAIMKNDNNVGSGGANYGK